MTRITGALHGDVCTFMMKSLSILLRMRNISGKIVGKSKIHVLCSKKFFFSENRAVDEIMWENVVEPDRTKMAIQYSAYVLHVVYLKLQTHAQNMEYLLFSTTIVTRTRINFTLSLHCLSF
jgi:hypothetical protein